MTLHHQCARTHPPPQSVAELEASRGELGSQAAAAASDVARLSTALQDMEHQRAGLMRKLSM
jgi:hypothetical protein